MRKIFLLAGIIILSMSLAACSSSSSAESNIPDNDTVSSDSSMLNDIIADDDDSNDVSSIPIEEMLEKYEPPADSIKIDMSADDPSNDEITFMFDGEGKVQNYQYTVNGMNILTTYDYDYPEEGKIWVLAFSEDGTVIAEEKFDFSKNDDGGFTEYKGYYFKNITVS